MKPHIAISIGDLNGVGIELALRKHKKIKEWCKPIYCINKEMLSQACELLNQKFLQISNSLQPKESLSLNLVLLMQKQDNSHLTLLMMPLNSLKMVSQKQW